LCASEGIPFVLGHALYLKAIHGGKTKTDTIDAQKLAHLMRGGTFAEAVFLVHLFFHLDGADNSNMILAALIVSLVGFVAIVVAMLRQRETRW
jgi:hypothetical protein